MRKFIGSILFLVAAGAAQAAESDSIAPALPTDVYADYMVVTPGDGFTSMLGHAAIRMYCPSVGLDYCFTHKSPEIGNEFTAMTLRTLLSGLVPEPTAMFVDDYRSEGRGISRYRLRLTVEEARRLWKLLDDEVARGLHRHMDYIRSGCAQEAFAMIQRAVAGRNINFDRLADESIADDTRRLISVRYGNLRKWKDFAAYTLYGGSVDETVRGAEKLIMPLDIANVLEKAGLAEAPEIVCTPAAENTPPAVTPLLCAIIFFVLCLLPLQNRIVNRMLSVAHFLAGILIAYMVFIARTPGTEWNWLVLIFNPVPFLISPWAGRRTHMAYCGILFAFLVFMLACLGRMFCIEQVLIVAGVFIRTIYKTFNINLLKSKVK